MKKLGFILPLVFLSVCASSDKKQHKTEHATVISQSTSSSAAGTYNAPVGNATVAVPIYRKSNLVVVETDNYRFEWSESGNKNIILPVNGSIEFYRDGD
jgi:hypothetical protein